jgi:tetratricopeptide (TPR) repeat protein
MYEQHPQPTVADARKLFNQKAYPEALQLCETLLTRKGPRADILTLKALIQKQSGNLEEAGKSMDLALSQDPDNAGMLFTAALINRQLSNFDLAKQQAMKAAREAPDNPQIICQCAMILGSLRKPQQALQILEKFMQKNKDQAEAWYLTGKFQLDLGSNEAADYALRKCITLQPDHANALKLLERVTNSST